MYNPDKVEKEILEFWQKNKIFERLRGKNQGKERFSFYDGPITANNPMGVHHAWGRTYKDIYQRFWAMRGFDQRYQNGFDCQGLWVEVEVEKDLGLNSKREIEKFGLEKFSLACKARVDKYSKIQIQQSLLLGQWMDFEDSYYTLSDNNIEHIWYFLYKCKEKGWIYQGSRVMPWCIRCGTSLSQHELIDSYKDVKHSSLYLKFPIKGKKNHYLLVWTTTPWTLTGNVAVAVHPELNYAEVKQGHDTIYLSEATLRVLNGDYIVLDTMPGKKLVGLEYKSPFSELEAQKGIVHKVVEWDAVGEQEGTGMVHIAPGCGAEDEELGKKLGLSVVSPIDEFGVYLKGFGSLTGKNITKTNDEILDYLIDKKFLYKVQDYVHRYPTCWRCGTDLVWRHVKEWFISCDEIRQPMIKAARSLYWQPEHVGKLMEDWLNNMGDWCISRKRYWGLPIPIWECENGHMVQIATLKELRQKAISGLENLKELHRPWIDEVKLRCPECRREMTRVKEVGDCWLDAGIVPFSTLNYIYDKEYWRKWFPADFVCEMREQVRLWFYSMLFMSITLEGVCSYKSILAHEKVHDEFGRPMHKSAGNAIWFDDAVQKMGADVMRWIYVNQNPQFNLNFGYKGASDAKQRLSLLYNLCSYLAQNMPQKKESVEKLNIEDTWILSRLNNMVGGVRKSLEELRPNVAAKTIEDFYTIDLSRTYIQLVRDRIQNLHGENRSAAIQTLYSCIFETLKCISPFVPFLSEDLYLKCFIQKEKEQSIFLLEYPQADNKKINNKLEEEFEVLQKVIQGGLATREKGGLGVRWPLSKIIIDFGEKNQELRKFSSIISSQLNIKEVAFESGTNTRDHINLVSNKVEDFGVIYLDLRLNSELEKEGFLREMIRRVQSFRKKVGLKKEDRIDLFMSGPLDFSRFLEELKTVTGAKEVKFSKGAKSYKHVSKEKIRDKEFEIGFNIL